MRQWVKYFVMDVMAICFFSILSLASEQEEKVNTELAEGLKVLRQGTTYAADYETIYDLQGNGTQGPLKIYNHLDKEDVNKVSVCLRLSDDSIVIGPSFIPGKDTWFFSKLPNGLLYKAVVRKKSVHGKTSELARNWLFEHWVKNYASRDEGPNQKLFQSSEPFMLVVIGTIPAINLENR